MSPYKRENPYRNPRDIPHDVCDICGETVTYVHYECELDGGYICDSPKRRCWEKYWLSIPNPRHWSNVTDTWHIWYDGRWHDSGWYWTEGF